MLSFFFYNLASKDPNEERLSVSLHIVVGVSSLVLGRTRRKGGGQSLASGRRVPEFVLGLMQGNRGQNADDVNVEIHGPEKTDRMVDVL